MATVTVVECLDSDGKPKFSVVHSGDVPLSTFVGLMEIAKLQLHQEALETWED